MQLGVGPDTILQQQTGGWHPIRDEIERKHLWDESRALC